MVSCDWGTLEHGKAKPLVSTCFHIQNSLYIYTGWWLEIPNDALLIRCRQSQADDREIRRDANHVVRRCATFSRHSIVASCSKLLSSSKLPINDWVVFMSAYVNICQHMSTYFNMLTMLCLGSRGFDKAWSQTRCTSAQHKIIPWCIMMGNPGKPDHISLQRHATSFCLSWFIAVVLSWDVTMPLLQDGGQCAAWRSQCLSAAISAKVCSMEGPGLETFRDKGIANAHYNWRHPPTYTHMHKSKIVI